MYLVCQVTSPDVVILKMTLSEEGLAEIRSITELRNIALLTRKRNCAFSNTSVNVLSLGENDTLPGVLEDKLKMSFAVCLPGEMRMPVTHTDEAASAVSAKKNVIAASANLPRVMLIRVVLF